MSFIYKVISCGATNGEQERIVRIKTRYVLDGPVIESRQMARFSLHVQSGPRAHPASYTIVIWFLFRGRVAGVWR
jgi:hypothetical protein